MRAAFDRWHALATAAWGGRFPADEQAFEPLARRCAIDVKGLRGDVLLLAVQSYFALVARLLAGHVLASCRHRPSPLQAIAGCEDSAKVRELLGRLHAGPVGAALAIDRESGNARGSGCLAPAGHLTDQGESEPGAAGDPFSWYLAAWSAPVAGLVQRVSRALLALRPHGPAAGDARGTRDENDCDTITANESGRITGWAGLGGANPWAAGDVLGTLYQQLLPRRLRHKLGQYFTPDWLAEHVLDQVDFQGRPDQRVLDPTCGSGVFLLAVLRRIRAWWQRQEEGRPTAALCSQVLDSVVGLELDPAAVLAARANYLMAVADWLPEHTEVAIPVILGDVLTAAQGLPAAKRDQLMFARWLGGLEKGDRHHLPERPAGCSAQMVPVTFFFRRRSCKLFPFPLRADREAPAGQSRAQAFDLVVGNPPWIAWDNLLPQWRRATEPLWRGYGLFTLSGSEARHGGAKKDLAMLVLYVCADRYLRTGGRLGMVIPQTVFQTRGAGEGFRHLRLGPDGEPLEVLRVDDLARVCPFAGATNLPATVVLEKGEPTRYPVRYVRWLRADQEHAIGGCTGQSNSTHRGAGPGPVRLEECLATPVDPNRPGSAWLVRPAHDQHPAGPLRSLGRSEYRAYLGANTGGANGVYWFELLDASECGTLRVRNLAGCGRRQVAAEVVELEPDLLYPLLRWGDVAAFQARPSAWILLAQDPATRTGIDEDLLRARWPRTYAYLRAHERVLRERAALRRFQRGRPFYSMYNVGPYTLAPCKVVWRRMDRRLRAAVVEPAVHGLLGPRPVVPQETCVFIPGESLEEAHYLSAMLNSGPLGRLVAACSVQGGKSFGTPAILDVLGLARFDPRCGVHGELAALSRAAHAQAGKEEPLQQTIERIDEQAARLLVERVS